RASFASEIPLHLDHDGFAFVDQARLDLGAPRRFLWPEELGGRAAEHLRAGQAVHHLAGRVHEAVPAIEVQYKDCFWHRSGDLPEELGTLNPAIEEAIC